MNVHVKEYSGRMEAFINEYPLGNDQVEKKKKKHYEFVIDSAVTVWPTVFCGLGLVAVKASGSERSKLQSAALRAPD